MLPVRELAPIFLGFVAILAIGYALRRAGRLQASAADALAVLVLDVTLPALILVTLDGRPVAWSASRAVLASWIALFVGMLAGGAISRALHLPRPQQGAMALSSGFSNTGFLGVPLVIALYGSSPIAGPTAVVIDSFTTTLWLNTVGVVVARRFGERAHAGAATKPSTLRLLVTPATVSVIVAIAMGLAGLRLPEIVVPPLRLVGNATTPLVLLAMGLRLRASALRGRMRPLLGLAVVKQLVVPAVALGAAMALGLRGVEAEVTVLESAMSAAMMSAVIADRYGCDGTLGTAAVVLTMLLSGATLPLWIAAMSAMGI